jgi:gelsolin
MQKKKTFDIEDSNVAGLGSQADKDLRKEAAGGEPAWKKVTKKPGMNIWRIEKFKVKVSQTPPGTFYSDDSYICLNTYEETETKKILYDIHFWLGKTTSQDEAGTAAYKTVELDDFLDQVPVQHREVEGYESALFCSYFEKNGGIKLLEGGIASGFNRVKPESYEPRLLHLKGRKTIRVVQVPIEVASLNEGDVFILDAGFRILQWQGRKCGKGERAKAGQLCRALDDERRGKPEIEVFMQGDKDDEEFWSFFPGGKPETIPEDTGDDAEWEKKSDKCMMQLSDASGSLTFTEVSKGKIAYGALVSEDVFIVDVGNEVYAWIGKGASDSEKKNALDYAQQYLKQYDRPSFLPICRILEGGDNKAFKAHFDS